jgi:hypothetical protein
MHIKLKKTNRGDPSIVSQLTWFGGGFVVASAEASSSGFADLADLGAGGVDFTRNPTFFKALLPCFDPIESPPIDKFLFRLFN